MDLFWEKDGWELEDKHLRKLAAMPFERSFPFIPEKHGMYIVRGPRQIGKSSWLKTVLSHYTQKKTSCFYLSCERVADYQELAEILKSVRNRHVVLLDEVNFVPHWDRAVKYEMDLGRIPILMLTGSHAYDLKLGADRMPGRFEAGGEFLLLPMGFEEFYAMRKVAGWAKADRLAELRDYFRIGGVPAAVAEVGAAAVDGLSTAPQSKSTYYKWLVGDIVKFGKNEDYLKEVLIQLAVCTQSPVSYQTLAKKTQIASHETVHEYLSILEACFAVKTLYAVDMDTGAYRFRKDKKFYFTDPMLYWLGIELSGQSSPENAEDRLAEMVAHEALSRKFPRFGYLSSPSGEVDFILPKKWAIELKWAPAVSNLSKSYRDLRISEKFVWTQNNYLQEWPHLNAPGITK
ncbi:ATP-binding protein [Bdellovibrionota bacterium FG-1]